MKIKSKKFTIALGALGLVAVSTVGFATWFVGTEQASKTNALDVTVSGTQDNGLILECIPATASESITLGEPSVVTNDAGQAIGYKDATGDLNIGLNSFKLYVSDTYYRIDKLDKITFTVKFGEGNMPTYNLAETDKLTRTAGDKTYIELDAIDIQFSTLQKETTGAPEGWKVYDLGKLTNFKNGLNFKYGTLFNNQTPATFYNGAIKAYDANKPVAEQQESLKGWSIASKELTAMKTAFDGTPATKINITTAVTFKA